MRISTTTVGGEIFVSSKDVRIYLLEEGVSFRQLQNQSKGEKAKYYEAKADIVEEIARLLKGMKPL